MKRTVNAIILLILILVCVSFNWSCTKTKETDGYINIDSADIYYKIIGGAPKRNSKVLVFLHGGPGLDHEEFLPFLQNIEGYTLIFYDQRGCGKSGGRMNLGKLKVKQLQKDLESIREYFGLKQLSLVAHGFGTIVALDYTYKHPAKVNKLFFMSPMGLSDQYEALFQETINGRLTLKAREELRRWEGDLMSSSLDTLDIALTEIFKLRLPYMFYDPEAASGFNLSEFSNLAAAGFLYSIDYVELKMQSNQVAVPIFITYGSNDPYPESAFHEYTHYFPSADVKVLTDCGHFPFIEKPDEIIELIENFFD